MNLLELIQPQRSLTSAGHAARTSRLGRAWWVLTGLALLAGALAPLSEPGVANAAALGRPQLAQSGSDLPHGQGPQEGDQLVKVLQPPILSLGPGRPEGVLAPQFQIKPQSEVGASDLGQPSSYIFELAESSLMARRDELERQYGLEDSASPAEVAAVEERIAGDLAAYRAGLEALQARVIGRAQSLAPGNPVLRRFSAVINGFVMAASPAEAQAIQQQIPEIQAVWPNAPVELLLDRSVPYINADAVWRLDANGRECARTHRPCLTGQGVTIGIIDTGVDYTHPDLGGCLGSGCKVAGGYDFVNGDDDPVDDHGHGTHVASIAAGDGALRGVAPGASIVAYKVFDSYGFAVTDDVLAALERSIDPNQDGDRSDHLDVINLSLGGLGDPLDLLSRAVDNTSVAGIVVVVAAGNYGPDGGSITSPGTSRRAITVGATLHTADEVAYFSSRGPTTLGTVKPDLTAPGEGICAAALFGQAPSSRQGISGGGGGGCDDGAHVSMSGTSMAAPHVAGVAALLRQKAPSWTPDQIKYALRAAAIFDPALGDPNAQGHGRVDALAAARLRNPPPAPVLRTFGDQSGVFDIRGRLTRARFADYELAIIPESEWSSGGWTRIARGTEFPRGGILVQRFQSYPYQGRNFLRLTQRNRDGLLSVDYAMITVDNFHLMNVPWFANTDVDIEAVVNVPRHRGYRLEISRDGQDWQTIVESNRPLRGKTVGTFPASRLANGLYWLRFSVRLNNRWMVAAPSATRVTHEILDGWPRTTTYDVEHVLVFDSNGDGLPEIASSELPIGNDRDYPSPASLYLWASDGRSQSFDGIQWPDDPSRREPAGTRLFSVFADGLGASIVHNNVGTGLVASGLESRTARYRPGWPQFFSTPNGDLLGWDFENPVIVVDLDQDGQDELVGSFDGGWTDNYLVVAEGDGSLREGFPVLMDGELQSSDFPTKRIGVADFDNDQQLEIAAVFSGSAGGRSKTILSIFELDGGLRLTRELFSSPDSGATLHTVQDLAIGDVNADGIAELIVLVSVVEYREDQVGRSTFVLVLNGDGRALGPAWPQVIEPADYASLALADLDGGGDVELVVTAGSAWDFSWSTKVFKADGSSQAWPAAELSEHCGTVVGDVDADGAQEVVSLSRGNWADRYILQVFAANGTPEKSIEVPFETGYEFGFCNGKPPVLTDIDRDGLTDVIAYGDYHDLRADDIKGMIFPIGLGTPYDIAGMQWPQWRHDNQSTAIYPVTAPRPMQCSDGLDNDLDGAADHPEDPECLSLDDDTESDGLVTPTPTPTLTGTPALDVSQTPTPTALDSPTPTATPEVGPTPTPTEAPLVDTPTPTPTPTLTTTATPELSPTPTPTEPPLVDTPTPATSPP